MGRPIRARVEIGAVHAIPVPRVGHFPLVVTRVPETPTQEPTVFVYVDGTARASAEACADPGPPDTWESAWLGWGAPRALTNGRWPRVGTVDGFEASSWPVPPGDAGDAEEGLGCTYLYLDNGTMRLAANLAEPWPTAPLGLIAQASAFEKFLGHRAAERKPGFWDMRAEFVQVTGENLAEWAEARRATERILAEHPAPPVCARQVEEGDLLCVPLDGGGFGVVLAARVEPRKRGCQSVTMLGLPVFDDWPIRAEACRGLRAEDVIGIWNCDTIGVRFGDWSVAGKLDSFSRSAFPVPFYTECFLPHSDFQPIEVWTERWGGESFTISDPDDVPARYHGELRRGNTLNFEGSVRNKLALYRRGERFAGFSDVNFLTTPAHAALWREMGDWAAKQAAG